MSAFFFGPAERQLFGFYHAPRGTAHGAAVICPSWGSEYQYAHRALRVAARRLAERGVHVLRFDYSGTGDSWGDTTAADMEQWQHDLDAAVIEMKAMSGQPTIDLIGLRVGALVAAAAAARRSDIGRVVMWDPVTDGAEWTRELNGRRTIRRVGTDTVVEFGQRLIASSLLEQFGAIRPDHYPQPGARSVLLLETLPAASEPAAPLDHLSNLERLHVEDAAPWQADTSIWTGLVPAKAVGALTDWMCAS